MLCHSSGNSSGLAPAHALPFSPAPPTTPLKQPNYHIPFSLKPIFRGLAWAHVLCVNKGPIPGVTLKDLRPGPGGGSSQGRGRGATGKQALHGGPVTCSTAPSLIPEPSQPWDRLPLSQQLGLHYRVAPFQLILHSSSSSLITSASSARWPAISQHSTGSKGPRSIRTADTCPGTTI
ncbi:unnamed protein product [Gadus morhua 'NCC']